MVSRSRLQSLSGSRRERLSRRRSGAVFLPEAAQQIAAQAFSVACVTLNNISEDTARTLVEKVAGYPGVTGRKMTRESNDLTGLF